MQQTQKHDWTNLNLVSNDNKVHCDINHMNCISALQAGQEHLSLNRMNPVRPDAHYSLNHMNVPTAR